MDFYALGMFILLSLACYGWFMAWHYRQLSKEYDQLIDEIKQIKPEPWGME